MVNIIDKKSRKALGEGRQRGIAYAFCKHIEGNRYETVQPASPCKDYLSDVVWAEANNKAISVWGLSYSKHDIYKDGSAFVYVTFLAPQNSKEDINKELELLYNRVDNMVTLINYAEQELGITQLTTAKRNEGDLAGYLFTISSEWCNTTSSISLWGLITRMGYHYEGDKTPADFLDTYSDKEDKPIWDAVKNAFSVLCKYKRLPKLPVITEQPVAMVHNYGFSNYNTYYFNTETFS